MHAPAAVLDSPTSHETDHSPADRAGAVASRAFRIPLERDLIVHNRTAVKHAIHDALEAGYRDIEVDASVCGYIDTTGLGVLVSCAKRCSEAGGSLTLVGVHGDVATLFEITRLDQVLRVRTQPPSASDADFPSTHLGS